MVMIFLRHLFCAKVNREAIDHIQTLYPGYFLDLSAFTSSLKLKLVRQEGTGRSSLMSRALMYVIRARVFLFGIMLIPICVSLVILCCMETFAQPYAGRSQSSRVKSDLVSNSMKVVFAASPPWHVRLGQEDQTHTCVFDLQMYEGHEVVIVNGQSSKVKLIFFQGPNGEIYVFCDSETR